MQLRQPDSEIFVPDGTPLREAVERTTVMGVGAHQDDLEILAYHGIVEAFGKSDDWFAGVVVTNGSGSPRDGLYADYTDDEMREIRRAEQKKAAVLGEYGSMAFLDYPSSAVKSAEETSIVDDLTMLLDVARPKVVYTHNLADKHDTHVGVTLRLIKAVRQLPADARPETIYGCEVWRDLDWLVDDEKVTLRTDRHENLAMALLGVFDSQIAGGKRYDLATMGRRRAHATYHASHGVDACQGMTFAIDLTPLVNTPDLDPAGLIAAAIDRFAQDVRARIAKLS